MPIKRYFNDQQFHRIQHDFAFLFPMLGDFKGETELAFRENYMNLYYRGNSAAKIRVKQNECYEISINNKFYPESMKKDQRFKPIPSENYQVLLVKPDLLHPLLQKRYLNDIFSKLKASAMPF